MGIRIIKIHKLTGIVFKVYMNNKEQREFNYHVDALKYADVLSEETGLEIEEIYGIR